MSDTNVTDNDSNEGGTATKAKKKKTFEMKEIHGVFRVNPDDLVIADDPGHPLYDERKDYPIDKQKLAYNVEHGLVGSVLTAVRDKSSAKPFIVDGRQRTKHIREANRLRKEQGLEPWMVEVRVIHGMGLEDAADLMETLNSFRTDDNLMVLARKALRRFERLKSSLKEGEEFNKKEAVASTAIIFNVSTQTVTQRLLALTACDEAQAACEAGKIGFGDLVEIAKLETKELQLAKLEDASIQRINFDGDQGSPAPDAAAAPTPVVRKRKLKGFGKKQLRKIVEDAPGLSAELQAFGRLILGDITGEQALREIPALKGYVKLPRTKKEKKAKKEEK